MEERRRRITEARGRRRRITARGRRRKRQTHVGRRKAHISTTTVVTLVVTAKDLLVTKGSNLWYSFPLVALSLSLSRLQDLDLCNNVALMVLKLFSSLWFV
ncbi:unnamed protein product [Arabidopsis halleri]